MIEVYNDCQETTLPQPQLQLVVHKKNIYIYAVDENGNNLACILTVHSTGETCFYVRAKDALARKDHSTDWAEWDGSGAFIKLK